MSSYIPNDLTLMFTIICGICTFAVMKRDVSTLRSDMKDVEAKHDIYNTKAQANESQIARTDENLKTLQKSTENLVVFSNNLKRDIDKVYVSKEIFNANMNFSKERFIKMERNIDRLLTLSERRMGGKNEGD